ncbi:MAG: hypothetical protein OEX76_03430, partial [Candidatus Bathyarchaeota archaeon]|nr:hypothetical protein [Candidatus Bathyarchaeota archaeon]
ASISYEGTPYSMSMSMKITETNMWSGAGFLPTILTENWLWVIIVVAVVTICIVVFVVSKLASRSAPPLPP